MRMLSRRVIGTLSLGFWLVAQGALAQTYSWPHWSVVDRDHYRAPSGHRVHDTYEGGIGHRAARRHGRHR